MLFQSLHIQNRCSINNTETASRTNIKNRKVLHGTATDSIVQNFVRIISHKKRFLIRLKLGENTDEFIDDKVTKIL